MFRRKAVFDAHHGEIAITGDAFEQRILSICAAYDPPAAMNMQINAINLFGNKGAQRQAARQGRAMVRLMALSE